MDTMNHGSWFHWRGDPALRIHPPDVIGKYCPESVIGALGSGAPAAPAASGGLAEPLLAKGGHQARGVKSHMKMTSHHGQQSVFVCLVFFSCFYFAFQGCGEHFLWHSL